MRFCKNSFDFWLSRENYKLQKESCDKNFCLSSNPAHIGLKQKLIPCILFNLNNILALCCKTGGKLRKKMNNCPKMTFFASKYFFLLDCSRLFFKLYMVWKMHSIQHEQYKMSLNTIILLNVRFHPSNWQKWQNFTFRFFPKKN